MCTNARFIYNPYSHKKVLVSCGHCAACQQEKAAARATRIRNSVSPDSITLFVTLTYDPRFVPFVKRSELVSDSLSVNIYRNCSVRFVGSSKGSTLKITNKRVVLDSVIMDKNLRYDSSVYSLKSLNGGTPDDIGVCYYKDVQNFLKRLRQILKRNYNYEEKFSFYACTEYGGYSQRPHAHLLFNIRPDDETVFRLSITQAWPYADYRRTQEYIEVAKDASTYVASYVNCGSLLSSPLQDPAIKQKHSYSKGFGFSLGCFTLTSLLAKVQRGTLLYYRQHKYDGKSEFVPVPIPKYVVNRFFPQFKGFNRFTTSQLFNILYSPETVGYFLRDGHVVYSFADKYLDKQYSVFSDFRNILDYNYFYTPTESYRIYVSLNNAFKRYHEITGNTRYDFAIDYLSIWRCYYSTRLSFSLRNVESFRDFSSYYENLNDYDDLLSVAPTLEGLQDFVYNPNARPDVVSKTSTFKQLFFKLNKQKSVTNYCMSQMDNVF